MPAAPETEATAAGPANDAPPGHEPPRSLPARTIAGGTDGNELLTTYAGVVLFVLLAVLGVTILRIGQLLWLHLFLGLLLLGPVALKLASTGYRFVRYYTHSPSYREKGPPLVYLRMLAPVGVLSTVVVFASGVALLLLGPGSRSSLLLVHKASFFVWLAATALHVVGHLPDVGRTLAENRALRAAVFAVGGGKERTQCARDANPSPDRPAGRAGHALALTGALAAGFGAGARADPAVRVVDAPPSRVRPALRKLTPQPPHRPVAAVH